MKKKGKIKIFSFVSLDGYYTKMDGSIDWLLNYPKPQAGSYGLVKFIQSMDCAVMNGIFFETLQSRKLWPLNKEEKLHIIISSDNARTQGIKSNFVILHPEKGFGYVEAIHSIRKTVRGDIWIVGNHEMISALMPHQLIDEIILNIVPVTLGNGYSLFDRIHLEQAWDIENCTCYDNGVVQMRYLLKRSNA